MANGYRNTYWGETTGERQTQIPPLHIEEYPSEPGDFSRLLYSEEDIMMGEQTKVYYFFFKDYLKSIGYSITYKSETEKRLINKFTEKNILIYKCQQIPKETADQIQDFLFLDDVFHYENKGGSITERLIKNKADKNEATIYVIDYNQLTRVYIFSNVIPDKIVVVYTEAYQEKF